jgi:hypothetical protein
MTPEEFLNLSPPEQTDLWASLSEFEQNAIREAEAKAKRTQINMPAAPTAKTQPIPVPVRVTVVDFDMSIDKMIGFIFKWALASIVVCIILAIPFFLIGMLFNAFTK